MAGFLKGIGILILGAITYYLSQPANLDGIVSPFLSFMIVGLASSFESYLKSESGNSSALFGTVNLK